MTDTYHENHICWKQPPQSKTKIKTMLKLCSLLRLYQLSWSVQQWLAMCIFIECEWAINSTCAHFLFYGYVCKTLGAPQKNKNKKMLKKKTNKKTLVYIFCSLRASWQCAMSLQLNIGRYILWTLACVRFTAYPHRFLRGHYKWHPVFTGRVCVCCFTALVRVCGRGLC